MQARAPARSALAARAPALLAWSLCGLCLLLIPASIALAVLNQTPLWQAMYIVAIAASALVGGLVAARRPADPVGWLFLGSACAYALYAITAGYADYCLTTSCAETPLARGAAWAAGFLTIPGVGLPLGLLPLYFPTGRLMSRRWRPVAAAIAVFLVLAVLSLALRPGPIGQAPAYRNPFGVAALRPLLTALDAFLIGGVISSVLTASTSLALRYRRARGVERQQMQWLTLAVVVWVGLILISSVLGGLRSEWNAIPALEMLIGLAFAAIPVAAGIAILRYRLYAIDRLIGRALLYGILTAAVLLLYTGVVSYLGAAFGDSGNFVVSAAATGLVAVLFQPLHTALQRWVNRLLYGRRDDPREVLASLGRRLGGALGADAVLPTIVETVARELRLPYTAIVLDAEEGEVAAAAAGAPVAPITALPLTHGGLVIGQLIVAARAPDELFAPDERRLLEDLARQAGAAVQAVRLTGQLQRSRERLVLAREEERRRLRNDLHDGLGPQLAALTLRIAAARNRLARDPEAEALFDDLILRTQATIADVRRVVYALRPPALDELGLRSALQEWVAREQEGEPGGARLTLHVPERLPELPAAVEVAVYRIAQEAVTNVVRHAEARTCVVSLAVSEDNERLTLEVSDDGRGMGGDTPLGVGLRSMRERAAELGGTLSVAPRAHGGTTVRVVLSIASAVSRETL